MPKSRLHSLVVMFLLGAMCVASCRQAEPPQTAPALEHTANASTAKGTLFMIGGGARPEALMRDLTGRMAHPDGLIIILPMASEEPDSAAWYARKSFERVGKTHVKTLNLTPADSAGTRADSLLLADLIYLCGGDQNRFMDVAKHPAVRQKIIDAYLNGAIIAGTSAGAAVMSHVMITGDQLLQPDYETTYSRLMASNAVYAQGLGLLPHAIVDQHFVERSRYNRAITALHDHPSMTVYGIGEATALVVTPEGHDVVGKGQVIVFEADSLWSAVDGRIGGNITMKIWVDTSAKD